METVEQKIRNIAQSLSNSSRDAVLIQNILRHVGFTRAIVTDGVVIIDGKAMSIQHCAQSILDGNGVRLTLGTKGVQLTLGTKGGQ